MEPPGEEWPVGAPPPTAPTATETWCVPINFSVQHVGSDGIASDGTVEVDLCDLMTDKWQSSQFRLDPDEYSPSSPSGDGGLMSLSNALEKKGREQGLELRRVSGNYRPDKTGAVQVGALVCRCALLYVTSGRTVNGVRVCESRIDRENATVINQSVKKTTLHNNKKNQRSAKHGGKSAKKRTNTVRRRNKDEPMCPFRLPIYKDKDEAFFFIRGSVGNGMHCYHAKPVPLPGNPTLPTRLLTEEQKGLARSIDAAHAGTAVNVNVINALDSYRITNDQFRSLRRGQAKSDSDDPKADVIEELHKNNARCMVLTHSLNEHGDGGGGAGGNLLAQYVDGATAVTTLPAMSASEEAEAKEYINVHRDVLNVGETEDVMVAFAWVLPFERQQFTLFPFVLHFDGTSDTNNEKRVLFTASGRDSNGNQFIVLRALIPNECAWMFKWLFSSVLPELLGEDNLKRVVLVVTDGDSQEMTQMDIAMMQYMPSAMRARCIWHIIDRAMRKAALFPSSTDFAAKKLYDKVRETIRRWLWSWAQNTCETRDEFLLSKALLYQYLSSKEVKAAFAHADPNVTERALNKIRDFVSKCVETHERYFAFYLKRNILAFETNSNSAHEGTNNGVKYNSAPTHTQHSVFKCTQVLCHQAYKKQIMTMTSVVSRHERHQLNSDLLVADDITEFAVGLLTEQWTARGEYELCRSDEHTWLCARRRDAAGSVNKESLGPIPQFSRVRTLRIHGGVLFCSCCYFERVGIPCRHMLSMLSVGHGDGYKGVSKYDIKTLWWKDYYYHGITKSDRLAALLERSKNDVRGPAIDLATGKYDVSTPSESYNTSTIWQDLSKPATQRCRNYTHDECRAANKKHAKSVGSNQSILLDFSNGTMDSVAAPVSQPECNEEMLFDDSQDCFESEHDSDPIQIAFPSTFPSTDPTSTSRRQSSHQECIPLFKEICNNIDASTDPEPLIQQFKTLCNKFLAETKMKAQNGKQTHGICSTTTRKQKTHGSCG